jgi:hypothetical protein
VEIRKKEKLAKKLEGEENEKKPKSGYPLERKGEENPKGNN